MFKTLTRNIKYRLACRKFFELHYRSTNDLYEFCNSKPEALYPSEFPASPFNDDFNSYNVITKDYLHRFYYGDLMCFVNIFGTNLLNPNQKVKLNQKYGQYIKYARKVMQIECKLMANFAHQRLVTVYDIKDLFHTTMDKAKHIWDAPEICHVGYPVNNSKLSKLKYNIYNSVLSHRTYYGFKQVDHVGIAFALHKGMVNYIHLKHKLQDVRWRKHYHSMNDELDHDIGQASWDISHRTF